MKKKILFLLPLLLTIGCQEVPTTTTENVSSVVTSESSEIEVLSTEEVSKAQISGVFIDVAIGRNLCIGYTYSGSIEFGDLSDQSFTFTNSNPENVEIKKKSETSNVLEFNPLKEGDTILEIKDSDEVVRYRNVISSRRKLSEQEIQDIIVEAECFKSLGANGGESTLTFLSKTNAVYSGYDGSIDLGTIAFTYKYDGPSQNTMMPDEYRFIIEEFKNEKTDMQLYEFYIDFTGELLHLRTKNITVELYKIVM